MQRLEVSGAVRYIYIYIYVIRRLKVKSAIAIDAIASYYASLEVYTRFGSCGMCYCRCASFSRSFEEYYCLNLQG
jgi:hypothetical protein